MFLEVEAIDSTVHDGRCEPVLRPGRYKYGSTRCAGDNWGAQGSVGQRHRVRCGLGVDTVGLRLGEQCTVALPSRAVGLGEA